MNKWLWAIFLVGGLIAMFLLSYLANSRTKKPEGCEDLKPDCSSCPSTSCALRTKIEEKQKTNKSEEKEIK